VLLDTVLNTVSEITENRKYLILCLDKSVISFMLKEAEIGRR
jgi:hypothetical protein